MKFVALALIIQIAHDILFYILFKTVPRGVNKFLDMFKDYAEEVSAGAILGDSFMMVMTVLFSVFLSNQTLNYNIIFLIVSVYLIPYILYTK